MPQPIDKQVLDSVTAMRNVRAASEKLRGSWSAVEAEVFGLLFQARVRPLFLRADETMFRIDWVERNLVEVPVETVIVDIADLARFGNLVGGDNETETKEQVDVSGIASTF